MEHDKLHAQLARARRETGTTGSAAKEVARRPLPARNWRTASSPLRANVLRIPQARVACRHPIPRRQIDAQPEQTIEHRSMRLCARLPCRMDAPLTGPPPHLYLEVFLQCDCAVVLDVVGAVNECDGAAPGRGHGGLPGFLT